MFVTETDNEEISEMHFEYLRALSLFQEFDDNEILDLLQLVTVRNIPRGYPVFRERDHDQCVYIILSGAVALTRVAADERETILSMLKYPEFFGEIGIFENEPRSLSTRTLSKVSLIVIERDNFLLLIERSPHIAKMLVSSLSARLREANTLIATTNWLEIRPRVAAILIKLSEKFGQFTHHGTTLALRLTNRDIGNMIGTTRETVNRTLNKFWDEGLIDMSTSNIIIKNLDGLKAIAPYEEGTVHRISPTRS